MQERSCRVGLVVVFLVAGCGGDHGNGGGDGGADASVAIDARPDAPVDAAIDAAIDAEVDASIDPGLFVRGEVRCLVGNGLMLTDGGQPVTVGADGHFAIAVADGAPYNVTVTADPQGQHCVVDHGSGMIAGASVDDVVVACSGAPRRWVAYAGRVPGMAPAHVRIATLDDHGCPAPPTDVTPQGTWTPSFGLRPTPDRRALVFDLWHTQGFPFYFELATSDLTTATPAVATIVGGHGADGAWRMSPTESRVTWDSMAIAATEIVPVGPPPLAPPTTLAANVDGAVEWSADGQRVAFTDVTMVGGDTIRNGYVADVGGTAPYPIRRLNAMWPQGHCARVRISPDGRFAFCQPNVNPPGNLLLVDVGTPASSPIDLMLPAFISADDTLAFTPDGRAAVVATPQRAYLVDLRATPPAVVPLIAQVASVAYIAMSPDGSHVLIKAGSSQRPDLFLVDLSGPTPGPAVRLNPTDTGDGSTPAGVFSGTFAFGGSRIVFAYAADSTHITRYWTPVDPIAVEAMAPITPGWGESEMTLALPGHLGVVATRYQPNDPTFSMRDVGYAELGPAGWTVRQLNPPDSFLDDNSRTLLDEAGHTLLFTARVGGGAQIVFVFDPTSNQPPQPVDGLDAQTVATFARAAP